MRRPSGEITLQNHLGRIAKGGSDPQCQRLTHRNSAAGTRSNYIRHGDEPVSSNSGLGLLSDACQLSKGVLKSQKIPVEFVGGMESDWKYVSALWGFPKSTLAGDRRPELHDTTHETTNLAIESTSMCWCGCDTRTDLRLGRTCAAGARSTAWGNGRLRRTVQCKGSCEGIESTA
jgi:hypothetical protein